MACNVYCDLMTLITQTSKPLHDTNMQWCPSCALGGSGSLRVPLRERAGLGFWVSFIELQHGGRAVSWAGWASAERKGALHPETVVQVSWKFHFVFSPVISVWAFIKMWVWEMWQ